MARHLLRRHRTEKAVAAIISLPPKSKKRIEVLDMLRRKGDYYHNICVLQKGKGQIVTCRQPKEKGKAEDFLPCSVCFGFFRKSILWKHEKTCNETLDQPKTAASACSARDSSGLCDAESDRSASRRANLEADRCNEKEVMTLTKDFVKLQKMLNSEGEKAKQLLLNGPNPGAYKTLSKILLSQITLFNGRRQAEVAAMPLQTYMNGANEVPKEDFMECLSPLEKNFIEEFTRCVIGGEGGEKVLVLLTKEMKESLDFLVDQRSVENCILDSNNFVFARQNSDSHLGGSSCLRRHAVACEAKRPETLTSTQTRVHVAILSQLVNLNDNQVDQLANLIGHDITEHREDSCLTENTLLLAQMSKRLMAMEPTSDVYSQDEVDLDSEGE